MTDTYDHFIGTRPVSDKHAFDVAALEAWLVPGEMSGVVHAFDARVGGGYEMSLRYPDSEPGRPGTHDHHVELHALPFHDPSARWLR